MSSTGLWKVAYEIISECQYKHGNCLRGSDNTDYKPSAEQMAKAKEISPEKDLFAPKDLQTLSKFLTVVAPELSVTKPEWLEAELTEPEMLKKLLDEDGDAGGFVVISGGTETRKDQASHSMSFCLQKSGVEPKQLGEGAQKLAEQIVVREGLAEERGDEETAESYASRVTEAAESYLEKKCSGAKYTLMRSHFTRPICLPLAQVRTSLVWHGQSPF